MPPDQWWIDAIIMITSSLQNTCAYLFFSEFQAKAEYDIHVLWYVASCLYLYYVKSKYSTDYQIRSGGQIEEPT